MFEYAGERSDLALQLADPLTATLAEDGLDSLYRDLELPLIEVLVAIERTGIRVDADALRAMSQRLEADLLERQRDIHALAGMEFNINSPKQLSEVLFEKLQLPALKKTGKTRATSTLSDRARRTGADARAAAQSPRLAQPAEAQGHLHRCASPARPPCYGSRPHLVQPGGGSDGSVEQQRPEPAEHPRSARSSAG